MPFGRIFRALPGVIANAGATQAPLPARLRIASGNALGGLGRRRIIYIIYDV
jgi:hypothetical protein